MSDYNKKEPSAGRAPALTRRRFLEGAAFAGAAGALSACRGRSQRLSGGRKPNLLFVFSDQQSYDMLGCYGNDQIHTPRTDRFAAEGVRFSQCVSSHPVCTPYRSILLSGQHPLYNGCVDNDIRMLADPSHLGEVLKREGYRMGYIGKWHLYGGDRDQPIPPGEFRYGFDDVFLSDNCTLDYRAEHSFYWNDEGEKVFFKAEDEWEVLAQTRQAIEFMDETPSDQPFCLFVSWHPPHKNRQAGVQGYETLPRLMDQYDPKTIRPRPNCPPESFNREWYHGHMAMCTGVDEAFGLLLDSLAEKNLDQNTLVVYTADHGDLLGSHQFTEHKAMPHEESVRVPLIMRWPDRLQAGRESDLLVGTLDLMPTLLGLLGVSVPDTCQGSNLAPAVVSGADSAGPEYQPLWHFWFPPSGRPLRAAPNGWRGVRTDRYTYARAVDRGPWILYDNRTDPRQMKNLIDDPAFKEVRGRLDRLTDQWLKRFGDPEWSGDRFDRFMSDLVGPGGIPRGRPIDLIHKAGTV
jgi:arylsulfatase A-like enzyme